MHALKLTHFLSHTHTVRQCQKASFGVFLLCSEPTLTSTVSEAVQDVSLVAQALKAAGVVDAGVVTGSLEGALVNV